ncbi:olfactory receptor 142-like [Seriola aureovittata]|uniref:olfactory receptor 142-like n=1 Tax=Seriola aureovittata TaxID=2871759 RepID=UPI0024BD7EC0|nr:olfactory receptor 142-like [Seriola aureovittata]
MILTPLYALLVCANVLLIIVICLNRSLYEPMYLFLCSLFVNELYGSTGMFPFLLVQILSDIHALSVAFCFLQIFCLHSYGGIQYLNLAIMCYDRYLAICCPLQYNTRMTFKKIVTLITVIWLYPLLVRVIIICLTSPLQLCGNIIEKVYCDSYSVVKLACSVTKVINIYGLITAFSTIILKVCFSGSKQTRQKAVSICTPHLVSLLNFSFGASFEILQSRFNMSNVPNMLRIFFSIYWVTCQPLFNPSMYGLNMSKMRIICKNLLFAEM